MRIGTEKNKSPGKHEEYQKKHPRQAAHDPSNQFVKWSKRARGGMGKLYSPAFPVSTSFPGECRRRHPSYSQVICRGSSTSERSCTRSRTTSRPSGEMSKSWMSKSTPRLVNCRLAPVSRSTSQRFL